VNLFEDTLLLVSYALITSVMWCLQIQQRRWRWLCTSSPVWSTVFWLWIWIL